MYKLSVLLDWGEAMLVWWISPFTREERSGVIPIYYLFQCLCNTRRYVVCVKWCLWRSSAWLVSAYAGDSPNHLLTLGACAVGLQFLVCVWVCLSVTTLAATYLVFKSQMKCHKVLYGVFNTCTCTCIVWILLKTLRSKVLASFAVHDCHSCFLTSFPLTEETARASFQQD